MDGSAIVKYEHSKLGVLYPERGVAELPVPGREHDVLIEHGDAEPAEASGGLVGGQPFDPADLPDITVVLELFDRRYRDVRGEDDAYSSEDPDYPHGNGSTSCRFQTLAVTWQAARAWNSNA